MQLGWALVGMLFLLCFYEHYRVMKEVLLYVKYA